VDLYDTKLLARHLPGVFEGDTSLGQVYDAVVQGSRREQVRDCFSGDVQHVLVWPAMLLVENGQYALQVAEDALDIRLPCLYSTV